MSNIIFKPGNWVYFMHNDRFAYGQIKWTTTVESADTKAVEHDLGNGVVRRQEEIFQTKAELMAFLMANVKNDAKS